jgi:hypothetical protein
MPFPAAFSAQPRLNISMLMLGYGGLCPQYSAGGQLHQYRFYQISFKLNASRLTQVPKYHAFHNTK